MSLRPGDTLPPLVVEAVSREPMKTEATTATASSPSMTAYAVAGPAAAVLRGRSS